MKCLEALIPMALSMALVARLIRLRTDSSSLLLVDSSRDEKKTRKSYAKWIVGTSGTSCIAI